MGMVVVCGGESASVLIRFEWKSLDVGVGMSGWGWVSDIVYHHYKLEYSVLNSIWPNSDRNTLFSLHASSFNTST